MPDCIIIVLGCLLTDSSDSSRGIYAYRISRCFLTATELRYALFHRACFHFLLSSCEPVTLQPSRLIHAGAHTEVPAWRTVAARNKSESRMRRRRVAGWRASNLTRATVKKERPSVEVHVKARLSRGAALKRRLSDPRTTRRFVLHGERRNSAQRLGFLRALMRHRLHSAVLETTIPAMARGVGTRER